VDDPHSRHTALSLDAAQTGDVEAGSIAGRDVHQSGFSGAEVQALLDGSTRFQERMLGLVNDLVSQINRDAHERTKRQARADVTQERLNARLARIELAQLALALLWVIGMVILIWLLVDRYAALSFLRIVGGGAAAAVAWRLTHHA
jgi:hypothetical protein